MTSLIGFGGNFSDKYLPEIKSLPHHSVPETFGYDGQWYAQLAVRPDITDPELKPAVDNLPYRARRILFCWTAYLLGLGEPGYILEVFALQNVVCWVLLALLMQRWFPPTNFENFFRWAAVLLSYGLCVSVHYSLMDGPSLLLVAVGVALIEAGRPWWAALILGVSGLGKETNILAVGAMVRTDYKTLREWLSAAVRVAITFLPLLIWLCYIFWVHGSEAMSGSRNFDPPFVALYQKTRSTISWLLAGGRDAEYARGTLYVIISLLTQFLFFVLRPRPSQPWWRVAIAFCVLMIFLGEANWDGYPGAAPRVLLSMTLAFNVMVPRGRWWAIVLLLGNLSVITAFDLSRPPAGDGYKLLNSGALPQTSASEPALRIDFLSGWYAAERNHLENWRWAKKSAEVEIYNSTKESILLDIEFEVTALTPRVVRFGGETGEYLSVEATKLKKPVRTEKVIINPGANKLWWTTDSEVDRSSNPLDNRSVGFRIYDLKFKARRADEM